MSQGQRSIAVLLTIVSVLLTLNLLGLGVPTASAQREAQQENPPVQAVNIVKTEMHMPGSNELKVKFTSAQPVMGKVEVTSLPSPFAKESTFKIKRASISYIFIVKGVQGNWLNVNVLSSLNQPIAEGWINPSAPSAGSYDVWEEQ